MSEPQNVVQVSWKVADLTFRPSANAGYTSFDLMRAALNRKGVALNDVKFSVEMRDGEAWLCAEGLGHE